LSGTLETEREIVELRTEKERIENETKRIENETEQIKRDNERLAALESKIDGLFLKYNIGLEIPRKPEKP
jgi:chaperonin cofactor prefoldin